MDDLAYYIMGAKIAGKGREPKGLGITGATPGQIVKVKAVDANGVPTSWEAADDAATVDDRDHGDQYDAQLTVENGHLTVTLTEVPDGDD